MQTHSFLFLCFLFFGSFIRAQAPLTERLIQQFGESDRQVSTLIFFKEQTDIRALVNQFEITDTKLDTRARILSQQLQLTARSTQEPVVDWLKNIAGKDNRDIRSFWIANCLYVHLTLKEARALSLMPEIAWLDWNAPLARTEVLQGVSHLSASPNSIEPGLLATNVPAMWALGYTGYGTKALIADTGVDPNHPALKNAYQGIYSSDQASWFEYDFPDSSPYDCSNHGTHVAGTVLGLDRAVSDTIGMAFNAKWIGATILCGLGSIDNISCFQWALDPDNDPLTVDDIPDVINNSWYDPEVTDDCLSPYEQVLMALEAAGVAVVFSAGNFGPDFGTIAPPHNLNYDLLNSYTVAAVNGNFVSLPAASFSSRGPSNCGGTGSLQIKPEVSAPGVDVRSSLPDGMYGLNSGTSMAAPHVTGALLILKEAFPQLGGRDLKEALYLSARDIGPPGEDNIYGNGIIDVFAAFAYLLAQGHIAQDPVKDHDVHLLALNFDPISCSGLFSPTFIFENNGKEPLSQVTWSITLSGKTNHLLEGVWNGFLLSGESISFQPGEFVLSGGMYTLMTSLSLPNGSADERPLDNIQKGKVHLLEKDGLAVHTYPSHLPVCTDSEWVRHEAEFNGPGEIKWYNQKVDGELLGTGKSLWLEADSNTSVYGELIHFTKTGKPAPESNTNNASAELYTGMTFDVLFPMILNEITVYAVDKGLYTIKILDNSNEFNTVGSKIQLITSTGPFKVNLGIHLEPGSYQIILEAGKRLRYDASQVTYPIVVNDILQINGPNFPFLPADAYYYFYDWGITYTDPCGRQLSTPAISDQSGNLQLAISGPDTILVGQSNIYSADLMDVISWGWRMNNDSESQDSLFTMNSTEPGLKRISLWASGNDSCFQQVYKDILVLDEVSTLSTPAPNSNNWQVYPNPARDRLFLQPEHSDWISSPEVDIQWINALGTMIHQEKVKQLEGQLIGLEVEVPAGFYFLSIKQGDKRSILKVAVQ